MAFVREEEAEIKITESLQKTEMMTVRKQKK